MAIDSEVSSEESTGKSKQLFRLRSIWTAVAVCIFFAVVGWNWLAETDHQIANFAAIGLVVLAWVFVLVGVWRNRFLSRWGKLFVSVLPLIVAGVFSCFYEYTGVSGEVLPQFRLRAAFRAAKVVRPQRPDVGGNATVSDAIKGLRFTQYLGNERDGKVVDESFSVAWDQAMPRELWRRDIGAGWSGVSIAQGLAVTLEQLGDEEAVTALRVEDGETQWQVRRPGRHFHPLGGLGPRSTPTLVERHGQWYAVALTATGRLICVVLETGEVLWERSLLEITGITQEEFEKGVFWGRSASPLVVGERVIVPVGGSKDGADRITLMACLLEDGSVLWKSGNRQVSYASPMLLRLDGVEQIVSVNEGVVTGHSLEDGRELWETPWHSKSDADACASQPVQVGGDKILFGKGYAQGSKLVRVRRGETSDEGEKVSGSTRWRVEEIWVNARVLKTKLTSAIYDEGRLYALSDGILECVDAEKGDRVWRGGRYGQGQLLFVNGALLILSEDGRIVLADKETGKVVAQREVLEGTTWNTFAIAGAFLIVRNGTQVVCLKSEVGAGSGSLGLGAVDGGVFDGGVAGGKTQGGE
jgi:outer membrane protein assembly factor BamB